LEPLAQQPWRLVLDEDRSLKVEPRREAPVLVGGASVTVRAPMFAAPVRIERVGEGDVRALVLRQDRGGGIRR
jgi:hypothetical protein